MIHRNLTQPLGPRTRAVPVPFAKHSRRLAGRPELGLLGRTFLVTAIFLLALDPAQAAVRSFELSQTTALDRIPTQLRVYARVLDARNEPVFQLDDAGFTATLGDRNLELRGVKSFEESNEGVAYIFLVDISRSLSEKEFGLIQESLETWMTNLRGRDRAAILAFGDESRLVVDFTNDADRLRESINALGPTDNSTVFFQALQDGFELARRRDPKLPGRRALIVLTDGRDEGSGWSFDDILGQVRQQPTPIYAIGLSRIRDAAERDRYLQLLGRLATNSGGAFFEPTDSILNSYAAIREAIHNVWVLDFLCPDCNPDGESYRLQINLSDAERIFSDGQSIRLLPPSASASATQVQDPALEPSPADTDAVGEAPAPAEEDSGLSWWWLLLPLLAALAAGWLVWNRRSAAPTPRAVDIEPLLPTEPVPTETYATPTGVATTRPPRPVKLRVVRLITVRGSKPGKQYSLTLLEKAVVGARSTCDCVLVDEPGVSPEQFELYQMDGHVFIRSLDTDNPTLVDGLPTEAPHRIQSEALVGTRDFIVRIIFGEGRATARG